MIKQLFIQAFNRIRENPYVSFVSVLGTALCIAMLMAYFIGDRSNYMDVKPEVNRHRTLYVKWVGIKYKDTGNHYANGYLSLKTIDECFRSLETPEAVTVTSPLQSRLASVPGTKRRKRSYILFTDDVFWKVFDFTVLAGKPYNTEEFESGIKKIVLSKQLSGTLFTSPQEAIGKQIQLNYVNYTVCAVVDDVSPLADTTFAQAWIPYTSTNLNFSDDAENITGKFKCQIIASSRSDFDKIREEIEKKTEQYNSGLKDFYVEFYRQPDTKYVESMRFGAGYPSVEESIRKNIMLFLVFLIIPSINLSSFTLSSMKKRISEFGVRRSFGSTRAALVVHALSENLIYSLAGGVLGLFISYFALYQMRDFIFASTNHWGLDIEATVPPELFINWQTFAAVFLFCLLLNLTSAFIPVWKVTSTPIVNSLRNE